MWEGRGWRDGQTDSNNHSFNNVILNSLKKLRTQVHRVALATRGARGGFVSDAAMSWRTPHQLFHFLRAGSSWTLTIPYKMLCTRRYGSVVKNRIRTLLLLQWMSKQLSVLQATHRQRNSIQDFASRPSAALHKI